MSATLFFLLGTPEATQEGEAAAGTAAAEAGTVAGTATAGTAAAAAGADMAEQRTLRDKNCDETSATAAAAATREQAEGQADGQ